MIQVHCFEKLDLPPTESHRRFVFPKCRDRNQNWRVFGYYCLAEIIDNLSCAVSYYQIINWYFDMFLRVAF